MAAKIKEFYRDMFTDVGSKLKSLSRIIFWVLEVFTAIAAIGVLITNVAGNRNKFAGLILGLILMAVVLAIGTFLSWITVLMTYAFGVIVNGIESGSADIKELKDAFKGKESPKEKAEEVPIAKEDDGFNIVQ